MSPLFPPSPLPYPPTFLPPSSPPLLFLYFESFSRDICVQTNTHPPLPVILPYFSPVFLHPTVEPKLPSFDADNSIRTHLFSLCSSFFSRAFLYLSLLSPPPPLPLYPSLSPRPFPILHPFFISRPFLLPLPLPHTLSIPIPPLKDHAQKQKSPPFSLPPTDYTPPSIFRFVVPRPNVYVWFVFPYPV